MAAVRQRKRLKLTPIKETARSGWAFIAASDPKIRTATEPRPVHLPQGALAEDLGGGRISPTQIDFHTRLSIRPARG
jgi:hypothetical protein